MRIAVDVMGGDHAPDAVLKGCMLGLELLDPTDQLVLVGPEKLIKEYLDDYGLSDPRLVIHHAPDAIGMDESPVDSVKNKPNSSINVMSMLGSKRSPMRCDAVLSAGNTGACVAAATMYMRRLDHVHRPGIAVTIPTFKGPFVMMDAGGNPEPRAMHLAQYGLIGSCVAERILKRPNPRVAVLNIGTEEAKGTEMIQETYRMLKAVASGAGGAGAGGINFIGYIEARELFDCGADVVVCDGLLGNTVLKAAEGMAKSIFAGLSQEIIAADSDLMLRLEPIFKEIFKKNDYHEHGGAPLLGVNGICMIAHGSSQARSIRAAIKQCQMYVKAGLNQAIVEKLAAADAATGNMGSPVMMA